MKSRVTPSSLPTREIKSSWIRIAILSGVRTRDASVSFVLAFAKEDAPRLIVIIIDAIRNTEIFLNITYTSLPATLVAWDFLMDLSGSILRCLTNVEGWQLRD